MATRRSNEEVRKDVSRILSAAESADSWKKISEITELTANQIAKSMTGHPRYLKRIEKFLEENKNQLNRASQPEESHEKVKQEDVDKQKSEQFEYIKRGGIIWRLDLDYRKMVIEQPNGAIFTFGNYIACVGDMIYFIKALYNGEICVKCMQVINPETGEVICKMRKWFNPDVDMPDFREIKNIKTKKAVEAAIEKISK